MSAEIEKKIAEAIDNSKSKNTRETYAHGWQQFIAWCEREGYPTAPPSSIAILGHLIELKDKNRKPTTITTRLASIVAHLEGISANSCKQADFKEAFSGIIKAAATNTTKSQAEAMTETNFSLVIAHMSVNETDKTRLTTARDKCMFWIMRDGLLRRSEMSLLNIGDFKLTENGSGVILIKKSKTDQYGVGDYQWLSNLCVEAMKRWLMLRSEHEDLSDDLPLICPVTRSQKPKSSKRLQGNDISRRIKHWAWISNLENPESFSGHSMRVGMACTLADNNVDIVKIAKSGRWVGLVQVLKYTKQSGGDAGGVETYYKG